MTAEAVLTRELNIRFIDARALCNDAKLGLGVVGYPSPEQEVVLVEEAKMIFRARPEETQRAMITLKSNFDAVRKIIPKEGSTMSSRRSPSCDGTEEGSDAFWSPDIMISAKASSSSRKFKLWPLVRRRQVTKSRGEIAYVVAPLEA
jgi:hypothetical protein